MPEEHIRDRRVATLDALGLLSASDNTRFDRVIWMLSDFFQLPKAAIVLAHRDTLIVKSSVGLGETPSLISGSFTEQVMASHTTFVVEDASEDPRFAANPLVTGAPYIRAYIGQPLRAAGEVIGCFAMAGTEPRVFSDVELDRFRRAAGWIEEELARETELVRAAEVQKSLLPKSAPRVEGYEIAGASTPSRSVGGDFYDWYPVPDGLGFTVADVMGKGVGAAIVAATVRAVIRTSAPESGTAATVTRAARALDDDLTDTASFVTLFHAKLRQRDGRVRYVDAGHGLALVIRADGSFTRLAHTDLPLGTAADCSWQRHTVWLGVDDTLLVFSDGVLDLFDGTVASLEDVVAMVVHGESITDMVASLTRMAELDSDIDDVVILGIRRTAP